MEEIIAEEPEVPDTPPPPGEITPDPIDEVIERYYEEKKDPDPADPDRHWPEKLTRCEGRQIMFDEEVTA